MAFHITQVDASRNQVYDPNTLSWVSMKQPVLETSTAVNLTTSGLAKETGGNLGTLVTNTAPYTTALDYDGSNNPIYIGIAAQGSLKSAAAWQIRKLTFDGSNNVTDIRFANGSSAYNAIWDNRAALSYA